MAINAPELRRVLAHIEANQDHWFQAAWRADLSRASAEIRAAHGLADCGTAFCFAGWKAELDGVAWSEDFGNHVLTPDGPVFVERYAAKALGLTEDMADELFCGSNTLDDLRRIVGELCEQAESEAAS